MNKSKHRILNPPETIWLSFRGIENGECTVVRWSTEQESDSDVLYTPVFRPVCDWKTEYSRAVELHNQTLDELNVAYGVIKTMENALGGCLDVLQTIEPSKHVSLEELLDLKDSIVEILSITKG